LAKWLETIPASERTGKVWNKSEKVYYYHQRVACKKAKVVWKDNGLRHSAISCRTCNGVTLSEIADWAGNSISEIKKHYLALISKSDAEQWWNI
jgi:hypothetical protein